MAQRRRKEQLAKQKQRRSILLCIGGGIGAMLLSLIICIIVFGIPSESEPVSASVSTLIPYDVTQPFSTSDLTSAQMNQLRASGRISVSDGPRGISVGDSLDTLLSRYPSTYTDIQNTGDLTGEQSNEEMILYLSLIHICPERGEHEQWPFCGGQPPDTEPVPCYKLSFLLIT